MFVSNSGIRYDLHSNTGDFNREIMGYFLTLRDPVLEERPGLASCLSLLDGIRRGDPADMVWHAMDEHDRLALLQSDDRCSGVSDRSTRSNPPALGTCYWFRSRVPGERWPVHYSRSAMWAHELAVRRGQVVVDSPMSYGFVEHRLLDGLEVLDGP